MKQSGLRANHGIQILLRSCALKGMQNQDMNLLHSELSRRRLSRRLAFLLLAASGASAATSFSLAEAVISNVCNNSEMTTGPAHAACLGDVFPGGTSFSSTIADVELLETQAFASLIVANSGNLSHAYASTLFQDTVYVGRPGGESETYFAGKIELEFAYSVNAYVEASDSQAKARVTAGVVAGGQTGDCSRIVETYGESTQSLSGNCVVEFAFGPGGLVEMLLAAGANVQELSFGDDSLSLYGEARATLSIAHLKIFAADGSPVSDYIIHSAQGLDYSRLEAAAVPEPSTALLTILGGLALFPVRAGLLRGRR
jgi:hypothetical protein